MDGSDLFDFVKKRGMIEEIWLREFNQPNTHLTLLDDTIDNMTLINNKVENNTLTLVNPWTIIQRGHP